MYLPDEFLRHAADCQRMAKVSRDPTSKATWRQMAQRWVQCAAWAKTQGSLASSAAQARRQRVSRPTRGQLAFLD